MTSAPHTTAATDRAGLIGDFLQAAGWAQAARAPLAGDASNRRYERLCKPNGSRAVLMDAPAERGEDVGPFLAIAHHLRALGLSAPGIIAECRAGGLLLLEDLGDDLFARVLTDRPQDEPLLYSAATDLLVRLHEAPPPPHLAPYDPQTMGDLAALALDWYAPAPLAERQAFAAEMADLCARHAGSADVLVQRDYHAENLIWLPGRSGVARVGLLDFQDARAGHRAYDLISLLEDARRDVSARVRYEMLARYIALSGVEDGTFRTAAAVLAAQRNLRILGVFARLCQRDGKAHYVDLIPRVWTHLERDLVHPALAPLRLLAERALPRPSLEHLAALKERCGKLPTAR